MENVLDHMFASMDAAREMVIMILDVKNYVSNNEIEEICDVLRYFRMLREKLSTWRGVPIWPLHQSGRTIV